MSKGIQYILVSGICFMFVNFFVKLLGGGNEPFFGVNFQQYGAHELVFFRSFISFSISAYVIQKKKLLFFGNDKKWLIIRGVTGGIALTLFFFTLQTLPLAIASILQYLSPIFTVILAVIFLKDKILKLQWIFILLAFVGVFIIAYDNFYSNSQTSISTEWVFLGIVSALFSGIAYIAIVKLKKTDTPINIVLYFPMIALPITGVWCLFDWVQPNGWEWSVLFLIGIFTQLAQVLMTKALHAADTARIVPFQYLGAVYAILIGWFVFDESLNLIVLLGIGFIVVSVILNAVYQYRVKTNA